MRLLEFPGLVADFLAIRSIDAEGIYTKIGNLLIFLIKARFGKRMLVAILGCFRHL